MSISRKTRSGRLSKVPERLELFEEIEDDFKDDEYDTDVDLLQSDDEDICSDDEESECDSDEDENGNLKGFVVDDEDDDDDEDEESSEDEETSWLTYVLVITGVIILGVAAGLLYTRKQESNEVSGTKDYAQGGIINQLQPIDASTYTSQQTVTPSYDSGYGQQAQAVQPVQPVVSEPVALQQWTDANGHTFRKMDDGSTMWWNGTDWQKYA